MARRYVQVSYPWAAAFEAGQSAPLAYLADLIRQALRYGMPARRYGAAGAWLIRHGVPKPLLTTALRARRRGERPDIDSLIDEIAGAWSELTARARWLPSNAPEMSALALKRRSALTVFLFGVRPEPLVVCKVPRGDAESLDLEARALGEAEPAGIGPRFLGKVGDAYVQEALPGAPLAVAPVTPDDAGSLEWTPQHRALGAGFIRLAEATRRPGPPQELRPQVKTALQQADLPKSLQGRVTAALEELETFEFAVLRHGDTSAQNCLFEEERLSGLVDWEIARPQGAPGFDILNAAVALLDHGVGLVNWSEDRAVQCFETAWTRSPFFEQARVAARDSVEAAGATPGDYERLEVAFFARRLASRLADPEYYATGPDSAARMLEIACERS
jgi:Phosphotransferase enzyme family